MTLKDAATLSLHSYDVKYTFKKLINKANLAFIEQVADAIYFIIK